MTGPLKISPIYYTASSFISLYGISGTLKGGMAGITTKDSHGKSHIIRCGIIFSISSDAKKDG
jgi:hypothetical protein